MKPRKTLAEMARDGSQPMQISGKPADRCPYCGAAMLIDGVNRTQHDIVRYIECRNPQCGKRFMSRQPPARLVREIGAEDSAGGNQDLTMALKYA